jgi:hypothetical protein
MDPSGVALDRNPYVRHDHLTDNAICFGVNLRV